MLITPSGVRAAGAALAVLAVGGAAAGADGVLNPEEVALMAAAEPPTASTARAAPAAITPLGLISIAPG